MKTLKDVKKDLTDYLYRHFTGLKREAAAFVNEICEKAAFDSIKDLMEQMGEYGILSELPDRVMVWQHICLIHAWTNTENVKELLAEKRMEFFADKHEYISSEVCHFEELPYAIQMAVVGELELDDGSTGTIGDDFYEMLSTSYPELIDLHWLYFCTMRNDCDFQSETKIEEKLGSHMRDEVILNHRIYMYIRLEDEKNLDRCIWDAYRIFAEKHTSNSWISAAYAVSNRLMLDADEAAVKISLTLLKCRPGLKWQEVDHVFHMYELYCGILQSARFLEEEDVVYIVADIRHWVGALCDSKIPLDKELYCNFIGDLVILLAEKLTDQRFHDPFRELLDDFTSRRLLETEGYSRILPSGYRALESYKVHDDIRFPSDIREYLVDLYGINDDFDPEIALNVVEYLESSPGAERIIGREYPYLDKFVRTARKKLLDKKFVKKIETSYFGQPHTVTRQTKKIGRNDPCPCGSGRKYKHCCGK